MNEKTNGLGITDPYNTDSKKEKMLEGLTKALGIVSTACEFAGVARTTHYEWMKTDEDYKKRVDDIKELKKDFVETMMLTRIKEGSDAMLIWYSKTQMRDRGFVEKLQLQHEGQMELKVPDWFDEPTADNILSVKAQQKEISNKSGRDEIGENIFDR